MREESNDLKKKVNQLEKIIKSNQNLRGYSSYLLASLPQSFVIFGNVDERGSFILAHLLFLLPIDFLFANQSPYSPFSLITYLLWKMAGCRRSHYEQKMGLGEAIL